MTSKTVLLKGIQQNGFACLISFSKEYAQLKQILGAEQIEAT